MKGVKKVLRNCDPLVINRNLIRILGEAYRAITVLPSGDFCVNVGPASKYKIV